MSFESDTKADLPAKVLDDLDAALETIRTLENEIGNSAQIELSKMARHYFEIRARQIERAAMARREDPFGLEAKEAFAAAGKNVVSLVGRAGNGGVAHDDPATAPIYDMTLACSAPHGVFDRTDVPENAVIDEDTGWPVFLFDIGGQHQLRIPAPSKAVAEKNADKYCDDSVYLGVLTDDAPRGGAA